MKHAGMFCWSALAAGIVFAHESLVEIVSVGRLSRLELASHL